MTELIDIVELECIPPAGPAEWLYLADAPMRPFAHTDADRPNRGYQARIIEPPSFQSDIYADPSRMAGSIGAGTLVLSNADQALSYLRGYTFGAFRWLRGRAGQPWAAWERMAAGRAEAPRWTVSESQPTRLVVSLYDRRADLDADVQTATFAGTNVGAAGLDGDEGMAGRVRPIALGDLTTAFLPVTWANTAARIAQVSEAGFTAGSVAVYDRGGDSVMSLEGDHAAADLAGATLTTTQFATASATGAGLVRLGGALGGEPQFGCRGVPAAGLTAPSIARWLLLRRAGGGAIGATLDALAASATAPAGLWLGDRASYRQAVEPLCRSWGGWLIPDRFDTWQAGALPASPGAPLLTLDEHDVVRIEQDDAELARPVWRVRVNHAEVLSVMSRSQLAPAAWETARETLLRDRWRTAEAVSAAAQARPDRRELEVETALRARADAQALADRLLSLLSLRPDGEPRMSLRVAVEMTAARLAVPHGGTVRLAYAPDGIDRPMIVMGVRLASPKRHLMQWRLFG